MYIRRSLVVHEKSDTLTFPSYRREVECGGCNFASGTVTARTHKTTFPGFTPSETGARVRPVTNVERWDPVSTEKPTPASGIVKMTPIVRSETTVTSYVSRVSDRKLTVSEPIRQGNNQGNFRCARVGYNLYDRSVITERDLDGVRESAPTEVLGPPLDLDPYINEVLGSIIVKANAAYDALTDIGELPATLRTGLKLINQARNPIGHFRDFLKEARKNPKRYSSKVIAQRWLEFQYGIMPVIYSIENLTKVLERKEHRFQTVRTRRDVEDRFDGALHAARYGYGSIYEIRNVTHSIRGTCKMSFTGSADRLSRVIAFNPLRTVWDLTPYSLIVDWFIDVSTAFIAFGARYNLGGNESMCISVKTTGSSELHLYGGDMRTIALRPAVLKRDLFCTPLNDNVIPFDVKVKVGVNVEASLLQVTEYRRYVRTVPKNQDYSIQWNPRMTDWRRQLSATAFAWILLPRVLGALKL